MSYTVKRLTSGPIVLTTLNEDYHLLNEVAYSNAESAHLLQELNRPGFLIVDMSRVTLDLEELTVGAMETSQGNNPVFHHPKIREVLFISTDRVTQMAIEGLTHQIYGNVPSKIFDTLSAALDYTRSA